MRALLFDKAGETRTMLRLAMIDGPKIPEDGVLIRVKARPIQVADLAFIKGPYRLRPSFPQTAGLEGAGVVVRSDRRDLTPGARVAFRSAGTWAEFAIAGGARLIEIPDDVSDEVGCQMCLNPVTG